MQIPESAKKKTHCPFLVKFSHYQTSTTLWQDTFKHLKAYSHIAQSRIFLSLWNVTAWKLKNFNEKLCFMETLHTFGMYLKLRNMRNKLGVSQWYGTPIFCLQFCLLHLNCFVPLYEIHIIENLIPDFLVKTLKARSMKKIWKTLGIKTSCKRELNVITRHNNDPKLKNNYKIHCNILPNIINEFQRNTRSENLISKLQLSGKL